MYVVVVVKSSIMLVEPLSLPGNFFILYCFWFLIFKKRRFVFFKKKKKENIDPDSNFRVRLSRNMSYIPPFPA